MEKLAMDGGRPVRSKPMPARVMFGESEKKAVLKLFRKAM